MSVYLSTGGKGAGAWLHPPTEDITPLTNLHFAIAAKLRLNRPQTARQTKTRANAALQQALARKT